VTRTQDVALACTVDIVEASLETVAGNLVRAKKLAKACLSRVQPAGFVKYELAALSNLAAIALYGGDASKARTLLARVLPHSAEITYLKLGTLDTLALVELREGAVDRCWSVIQECRSAIQRESLPARSWYDLAHQATRCAYYERLGDWARVIEIADASDAELARRQYKAVRTSLLCVKARARARLGRHADAGAALAAAVRACPRGAVDPLIVLEASKALCASLRGDRTTGSVHYDRAIAACRAIGHRYHEWWITAQRDDVQSGAHVAITPPHADIARTSLVVSDVATILGAGHSIDLLAHRVATLLQWTSSMNPGRTTGRSRPRNGTRPPTARVPCA
jgi:ATP/maltotriose-dependent transcriptional regulator MalT